MALAGMTKVSRGVRPPGTCLRFDGATSPVCRILLALLTAAGVPAKAESDEDGAKIMTLLEEISVVALGWDERAGEVPYAVDSVPAAEIAGRGPMRGVPDALEESAGIVVQRTSAAQASPYLRGFTGFRTLLLVDGVRMNSATWRDGPNQYWASIDPYLAESIEVARGPFSVLYGSDAIGGTAELRTPELFGAVERTGRGRVLLTGASAEQAGGAHVENWGGGARFRWLVGATAHSVGDVEAGAVEGRQPQTGFEQGSWSAKGEYRADDAGQLVVVAQADRIDDAWRTHRTIFAVPWNGTSVGSDLQHTFDQERDLAYLRWSSERRGAAWDGFDATLSWSRISEGLDRVRADGRRDLQGFDAGTLGAALRFRKEGSSGAVAYGVEVSRERVDSESLRFRPEGSFAGAGIQGPVADDATYDSAGVYIQREIATARRWKLVLGGRFSFAGAEAGRVEDPANGEPFAIEESWSETTGDARILVRLDEAGEWRLWTGMTQGFRAPNLSDLSRFDVARSGEIETPAPGLEPERFLTYELGVRRSTDAASFEMVAFWNDLDGLIVRAPTGRSLDGQTEVTKRNAGNGRLYGLELAASRRWGGAWTGELSGSWLHGDVETYERGDLPEAEPIDKLPPARVALAIRRALDDGAFAELCMLAVDRADRLSTRDQADMQRIPPNGTPGYFLVALRGELPLSRGARLALGLENLLDADYRVHGSGQNGPGWSLVASLALRY